ncbi:hypothetical protein LZ318_33205 [Saccharopolyspora indica]|uniref:hypothetical protein n=1 Tax=Saccharopolyspora indica TaxID=1229659 RepID=UPI0022EB4AE5|nr:hypothetical protein [Saccharopolyspora indica]MDA3643899.1 hypothetical protein [Saccharopolyspora indica]
MGTITVTTNIDENTRSELINMGSILVERSPETWSLPPGKIDAAVEALANRKYEFQVFDLAPQDDIHPRAEQAAYLCPVPERELDELPPGPQLTYAEDGNIIANRDLIEAIAELTTDTQWTPHAREGFSFLSHAAKLPDPIRIRTLFRKWPRAGDKWVLSHDGREYLTDQNAKAISSHGLAWATRYQHREQVFHCPSILIWNGELIDTLIARKVHFSSSPVYYLRET